MRQLNWGLPLITAKRSILRGYDSGGSAVIPETVVENELSSNS
jgi:hypothetical protein